MKKEEYRILRKLFVKDLGWYNAVEKHETGFSTARTIWQHKVNGYVTIETEGEDNLIINPSFIIAYTYF